MMGSQPAHPRTPDGRYFIVRGRLWRLANPALPPGLRAALTAQLMNARRRLKGCKENLEVRAAARAEVEATKVALGERGAVWWTDGAPDYNRRLAKNTPYAVWFASVEAKFIT